MGTQALSGLAGPRVAILLGSHGHGSGAERVLEYLLEGACSQREAICLIAPRSSSVTTCARDLGYAWYPWEAGDDALRQNFLAAWKIRKLGLAQPLGSVVHSWHTRHLEWALFLGCTWKVASAGTIHDDPSPAHGQFGAVRKRIIRHASHHLTGLAVVSQAVADRCRFLGWTCPITILRNGLPDAAPVERRDGVLRIGFLATGMLWKGIDLLPQVIRQTSDLPLEWNLFGPSSEETAPIIHALSGMPRTRYHGRVPLSEALPYVDVLLHLSKNFDPYPTVLLEAARAGIPAITTQTGGSPEIVSDGETGFLIPPGEAADAGHAIRALATNPTLLASMGKKARVHYERKFGVERMVAEYFAFWNGLVTPADISR